MDQQDAIAEVRIGRIEHGVAHPEFITDFVPLGRDAVDVDARSHFCPTGEGRDAAMRVDAITGAPEAGPIGGTFLAASVPCVQGEDQLREHREEAPREAKVAESHMSAFVADQEAQVIDTAFAKQRIDGPAVEHHEITSGGAHGIGVEGAILDDVGLGATDAQFRLGLFDDLMKLGPLLSRDEHPVGLEPGGQGELEDENEERDEQQHKSDAGTHQADQKKQAEDDAKDLGRRLALVAQDFQMVRVGWERGARQGRGVHGLIALGEVLWGKHIYLRKLDSADSACLKLGFYITPITNPSADYQPWPLCPIHATRIRRIFNRPSVGLLISCDGVWLGAQTVRWRDPLAG